MPFSVVHMSLAVVHVMSPRNCFLSIARLIYFTKYRPNWMEELLAKGIPSFSLQEKAKIWHVCKVLKESVNKNLKYNVNIKYLIMYYNINSFCLFYLLYFIYLRNTIIRNMETMILCVIIFEIFLYKNNVLDIKTNVISPLSFVVSSTM